MNKMYNYLKSLTFYAVMDSSICEVKEKVKSKKYMDKLRKFIEQGCCFKFSTVEESMSGIARETTPFNTTHFENVVIELDCNQAKKSIAEYKRSFKEKAICSSPAPERGLTYFAKVETLSIAMNYPPNTSNAMIQDLLLSIFGDLFEAVVHCHGISNEHIICHFPLIYTSSLIEIIVDKFSFCKEKKVKMITVGCFSVVYDKFYDEV